MAYNKEEIFKNQNPGDFLVGKTSALQPVPNTSGYYVQRKHIRSQVAFGDRFISSFDSQINPNMLPVDSQFPEYPVVIQGYYAIEGNSTYFDIEGGSTYFDPA